MKQARNAAAEQSLAAVEERFPQFSREFALELSRDAGVCFKGHIMRVLLEFGYTDGLYRDLYKQLSKEGVLKGPEYVPVEQVLDIARRAGAVIVLAHPSVYRTMDLFAELAAAGMIDGVEIDHPRNTEEDKAVLREAARKYGLIVTGGSDFHGLHASRPVTLGSHRTDAENIARILELSAARKS